MIRIRFPMATCHKILLERRTGPALVFAALLLVLLPVMGGVRANASDPVGKLIEKLEDKHEKVRAKAARELGDLGDARAVEPLIKTLKDADSYVRGQSARSLGKLKDPRAVEPLILTLNDDYTYVKEEVARALGEMKNARAVEPLMNFLKDDSTYAREEAAKSLIRIGPDAIAPLVKARNEKNLRLIADLYPFFLCRGEPGTETLLVDALVKYGTSRMAGDFARCGSVLLKEAAYEWAGSRKQKIITPVDVGDRLTWGRCAN